MRFLTFLVLMCAATNCFAQDSASSIHKRKLALGVGLISLGYQGVTTAEWEGLMSYEALALFQVSRRKTTIHYIGPALSYVTYATDSTHDAQMGMLEVVGCYRYAWLLSPSVYLFAGGRAGVAYRLYEPPRGNPIADMLLLPGDSRFYATFGFQGGINFGDVIAFTYTGGGVALREVPFPTVIGVSIIIPF